MSDRTWVKLTYPLPSREWFQTEKGWASREWTQEARAFAEAGRGKFVYAEEDEE